MVVFLHVCLLSCAIGCGYKRVLFVFSRQATVVRPDQSVAVVPCRHPCRLCCNSSNRGDCVDWCGWRGHRTSTSNHVTVTNRDGTAAAHTKRRTHLADAIDEKFQQCGDVGNNGHCVTTERLWFILSRMCLENVTCMIGLCCAEVMYGFLPCVVVGIRARSITRTALW